MKQFTGAALLAMFFMVMTAFSNDKSFERALVRIDGLQGDEFRSAVDSIYLALDAVTDYRTKLSITRELFDITAKKDEIAHIRSLTYMVIYSDTPRPELFGEAYRLALKHNRNDLLDYVEDRRSRYFISVKKYDSAMIHILRMQDLCNQESNDEVYRNVMNLLGDIYYNTKLYNQAKKAYTELYIKIAISGSWNFWRPYVIMNNLGEIEYQQRNYLAAMLWFQRSLHVAQSRLFTPDRDNIMAYTRLRIAETLLQTGKTEEAEDQVKIVQLIPPLKIYEDVKQELLFVQSRICFEKGTYAEGLRIARQLEPGDSVAFARYRFVPEIYRHISRIYDKMNQPQVALQYLQKYSAITETQENNGILARSMVILAEKNHDLIKKDLDISHQRSRNLIIFIVFLIAALIGLMTLYRRLYLSKLALIRLTLQTREQPMQMVAPATEKPEEDVEENEKLKQLADSAKELMDNEKAWLDPHLGILQVASMLNTNRTYLSKAINASLNMNFPNFINGYRIRESIRQITAGFTVGHTEEALALKSGFANRTVFIAAFKKYTGVTPSFFIANFQQQYSRLMEETGTFAKSS